jgi:N-acetylglutamate synthase-like GNAT family acetyltransferase
LRFLVLRADGVPAGCLGLHSTGELTRIYVASQFRRRGGVRALFTADESWARTRGLTHLFLDTRTHLVEARTHLVEARTHLVEARAFCASCAFIEITPPTTTSAPSRTTGSRNPSLKG